MYGFMIRYLSLAALNNSQGGDIKIPEHLQAAKTHIDSIKANPLLYDNCPIFKIGIVDGRVGGSSYMFPMGLYAEGINVLSASGCQLNVDSWARGSGLGFGLCDFAEDRRDGEHDVFEGAGMSQIAVKVHRFMGYRIFEYPRLIMLLKSRAVVEMKIKNWLAKPVSWIIDGCIWIYSLIVSFIGRFKTVGVKVFDVDVCDDAQLSILGQMTEVEGTRFSEVHDARWFKWVLNNSFSKDGPARAYLTYKKDKPVGFFMVKERFHEQASHRGFKNVWLGSVIEWGCLPGYENKLLWRIVLWSLKRRKKLDAVEFPAYERFVQKFLRRLGWQHVGDANFCYRVRSNSSFKEPEGMNNPDNWRLRPGMGDVALN